MEALFRIRSKVHALLENGRRDGVVKSSLSADVAISVSSASTSEVIDLLGREGVLFAASAYRTSLTSCLRRTPTKIALWGFWRQPVRSHG